jgi:hypothetical protein
VNENDTQTNFNLSHELWELKKWSRLVKMGINPKKAVIIAHNKNPFRTDENWEYGGK